MPVAIFPRFFKEDAACRKKENAKTQEYQKVRSKGISIFNLISGFCTLSTCAAAMEAPGSGAEGCEERRKRGARQKGWWAGDPWRRGRSRKGHRKGNYLRATVILLLHEQQLLRRLEAILGDPVRGILDLPFAQHVVTAAARSQCRLLPRVCIQLLRVFM